MEAKKKTTTVKQPKKAEVKKSIVDKTNFINFVQSLKLEQQSFKNQPLEKDFDFCCIFASLYLGKNNIELQTTNDSVTYNLNSFDKTQNFKVTKQKNKLMFSVKNYESLSAYNSVYTFSYPFCTREANIRYFPLGKEMAYSESSKLNALNGLYFSVIQDLISTATIISFLSSGVHNEVIYSYTLNDLKQFRKASNQFTELPYLEPYGAKTFMEMLSEHFNEFSDMMIFDDEYYFNDMLKYSVQKEEDKKLLTKKLERRQAQIEEEQRILLEKQKQEELLTKKQKLAQKKHSELETLKKIAKNGKTKNTTQTKKQKEVKTSTHPKKFSSKKNITALKNKK